MKNTVTPNIVDRTDLLYLVTWRRCVSLQLASVQSSNDCSRRCRYWTTRRQTSITTVILSVASTVSLLLYIILTSTLVWHCLSVRLSVRHCACNYTHIICTCVVCLYVYVCVKYVIICLSTYIFIITPKQQTVDKIIQYNTTQHNHHKSRKELICTVINQIKIWVYER